MIDKLLDTLEANKWPLRHQFEPYRNLSRQREYNRKYVKYMLGSPSGFTYSVDEMHRWSMFTMYWPQIFSCWLVGKE